MAAAHRKSHRSAYGWRGISAWRGEMLARSAALQPGLSKRRQHAAARQSLSAAANAWPSAAAWRGVAYGNRRLCGKHRLVKRLSKRRRAACGGNIVAAASSASGGAWRRGRSRLALLSLAWLAALPGAESNLAGEMRRRRNESGSVALAAAGGAQAAAMASGVAKENIKMAVAWRGGVSAAFNMSGIIISVNGWLYHQLRGIGGIMAGVAWRRNSGVSAASAANIETAWRSAAAALNRQLIGGEKLAASHEKAINQRRGDAAAIGGGMRHANRIAVGSLAYPAA